RWYRRKATDGHHVDYTNSIKVTVVAQIGTPSAISVTNNCGSTLLTRGAPPNGITWYWQSTAGGTSTANSSASVERTSGTVYYLRGRHNSSGCWGNTRSVIYSVDHVPATPTALTVKNNCGSTLLTRGAPPVGITWYW